MHAVAQILVIGLLTFLTSTATAQSPGKRPGPTAAQPGFAAAQGSAAPDQPVPPKSSTQSHDPTVSIEIVGEGSFKGTSDAQVRIMIKNNEPELRLCFNDIEIFPPTKFAQPTYHVPLLPNGFAVDCMDPGAQRPVVEKLQHAPDILDLWLTPYGYKEPIFAALTYELHEASDPKKEAVRYGSAAAVGEYVYHTPTLGLLVGAVIGWALSSVIIYVRASRRGKSAWVGLFTAGMGSLILTLLLRYGAGISLPVTLGVNDFYGALFVGLLSHRLASPLLAWLGIVEQETQSPAEAVKVKGKVEGAVDGVAEQG